MCTNCEYPGQTSICEWYIQVEISGSTRIGNKCVANNPRHDTSYRWGKEQRFYTDELQKTLVWWNERFWTTRKLVSRMESLRLYEGSRITLPSSRVSDLGLLPFSYRWLFVVDNHKNNANDDWFGWCGWWWRGKGAKGGHEWWKFTWCWCLFYGLTKISAIEHFYDFTRAVLQRTISGTCKLLPSYRMKSTLKNVPPNTQQIQPHQLACQRPKLDLHPLNCWRSPNYR